MKVICKKNDEGADVGVTPTSVFGKILLYTLTFVVIIGLVNWATSD